jgi:hypothetical protein
MFLKGLLVFPIKEWQGKNWFYDLWHLKRLMKMKSFAHFPLVPLVIDIKKSELSSDNITFNSFIKKSLFSKNK